MIATSHTIQQMSENLKTTDNNIYALIKRHAYYLIAILPASKYTMLRKMLDKEKSAEDISILIGVPITLITSAKRLLAENDYPASKQLGN
jgi:Trp operon repressor